MGAHRDNLLARLDEYQAKALAVIARGDLLLVAEAVPDPGSLSQSRWELTRILVAYQAFKHHALFNPIIRDGPPEKARLAGQMKAECVALCDEFRAHVAGCTNLDVVVHWPSYRPTIVRLLARIRAHLSRERWVVEAMLLAHVAQRSVVS